MSFRSTLEIVKILTVKFFTTFWTHFQYFVSDINLNVWLYNYPTISVVFRRCSVFRCAWLAPWRCYSLAFYQFTLLSMHFSTYYLNDHNAIKWNITYQHWCWLLVLIQNMKMKNHIRVSIFAQSFQIRNTFLSVSFHVVNQNEQCTKISVRFYIKI